MPIAAFTTHDWVAIFIALFSAVLVPVVGTYFKAQLQTAVGEMEDRMERFIRAHEKDPYAHPNLEILHRLEEKIDTINRNILDIKLNCVSHRTLLGMESDREK